MKGQTSDGALGRGVAWIGGVRWAAQIVSWGSTLFVVRLLHPEDYGIVGMATTYVQLAQTVTEFGVGTAVMARPRMSMSEIAQANTLTLFLGIVGLLVSLAVAVPVSVFFVEPRVMGVVAALSPLCLAGALAAVPSALLMRQLRYREAAVIDLLRSVLGSLSVLGLALAGAGYWALIGGQLIGAFVPLTVLLIRFAQPFERVTRAGIAPLVSFGKDLLIGRLAWMVYQSAHLAIAGRVLGTTILGQYSFAWTFSTLPGDKLSSVVSSVLPSVLVTVHDDQDALWRHLRRSIEILSVIMLPALLGLVVIAPDLIAVAFGPRWLGATVPLMLLGAYAMLQWFLPLLNQVLLVTGDIAFQRRLGVGMMLFLVPAFYVGARWGGIVGLCLAWLVSWPLSAIPIIRLSMRSMGRRPVDLWNAMTTGLSGAVVSAAIVMIVRAIAVRLGYGSVQVLAFGIPLAVVGHILTVMYLKPELASRAVSFLRDRSSPTPPAEL